MSKLTKQAQVKINQLVSDLSSEDDKKVAAAIKSFEVHGHVSVILPLMDAWLKGLSIENETLLIDLFQSLKDSSTIEPLMEAFNHPKYSALRRKMISAFWNSKLDFSEHLADFVLFAIEGDFLDTLEVLTLVENFETLSPESAVMESQLLLKEYFGQETDREAQKDSLLAELALLMKDMDEQDGTDDLFLE
jgi:hypothetical protein